MIGPPRTVALEEAPNGRAVEQTRRAQRRGAQSLGHHLGDLSAEPGGDRGLHTLFPTSDDRPRQPPSHRLAQDVLFLQPPHFDRRRQAETHFGQLMIEERDPGLERPGHRRSVQGMNDEIGQADPQVEVLQPAEWMPALEVGRWRWVEGRRRIAAADFAQQLSADRPVPRGHHSSKPFEVHGRRRLEQARGPWAKSPADRAERPQSAEPSGQGGNRPEDLLSVVPPVAAEHLVRSLSGEHHLDLPRRGFRQDHPRYLDQRQARRFAVPDRLVDPREVLGPTSDAATPVSGALVVREGAQGSDLVDRRIVEGDREGLQRVVEPVCGQHRHRARVETRAQPRTDLDIASQVNSDRLLELCGKGLDQLVVRAAVLEGLSIGKGRLPVPAHHRPTRGEDQ